MTKYFWATVIAVFVLGIVGCKKEKKTGWQTVEVNQQFSLQLPASMTPSKDMHATAILQYADTDSNLYVLGIEDAKENFGEINKKEVSIEDYFKFTESGISEGATDKQQLSVVRRKTKDFNVLEGDYDIKTLFQGREHNLHYRIAVYETKQYFYQIVVWKPMNPACLHVEQMDSITHSFQLIQPTPVKI